MNERNINHLCMYLFLNISSNCSPSCLGTLSTTFKHSSHHFYEVVYAPFLKYIRKIVFENNALDSQEIPPCDKSKEERKIVVASKTVATCTAACGYSLEFKKYSMKKLNWFKKKKKVFSCVFPYLCCHTVVNNLKCI